jgi:hypothetical protein
MQAEDADEYTRALGQIVAGSWRQIALAKRLGVPKALGLPVEQWVNERLGGHVRMSVGERREAVRNLTAEGHSAREIADIVGVSHETTASDVRNLTAIDAVAALAADEAVQKQIKAEAEKAEKEVARQAARTTTEIDDGCTVDDLKNQSICACRRPARPNASARFDGINMSSNSRAPRPGLIILLWSRLRLWWARAGARISK